MQEKKPVQIDIDKVFKDKNPRLYKFLPGFLLRWIKRTIKQEEINAVMRMGKDLKDAEFARLAIRELGVTLKSIGAENIPKTGGCIIASNHPLGGLDGMALVAETAKIRPDLRFIVNDILMQIPQFETVFVGVNKLGSSQRAQLLKIEQLYAEGYCILIFPAGICSRKIDGKITDLTWQKSFISKAKKYNLPVIPCFIEGQNSKRFYKIANIRKSLGIKANLEMFFLPDEMFRQNGKTLSMTYGKPIAPENWTNEHTSEQWAEKLRSHIYQLKNQPNLDFIA